MAEFAPFALETPIVMQPHDKLYFLHIQKTAGTSLATTLDTFFHPSEIFAFYPKSVPDMANLFTYRYYKGHTGYNFLNQFDDPRPLWITILRHPIDRLISHFYYRLERSQDPINPGKPLRLTMNFADFIKHPTSKSFHNLQTKLLYSHVPRKDNNYQLSQHVMNIVKQRLLTECAFLGITERYDDSMALLHYTFGWRPATLRHGRRINSTKKRPKKSDLDPQLISLIEEKNRFDIELYDFAHDLFTKRYDEMMRRLLQEHYEEHYEPVYSGNHDITIHSSDAIFDSKQHASGWHPCDIEHRWTGPDSLSWVGVYLRPNQHHIIEVEIERGVTDDILKTFSVCVNNHEINLVAFDSSNGQVFRGVINKDILRDDIRLAKIQFSVNHTVEPVDNAQDSRKLGVAFQRMIITRV